MTKTTTAQENADAADEILRVAVVWNFLTECTEIGAHEDHEGHDLFLIEMICNPKENG